MPHRIFRVVEFDSPIALLGRQDSLFRALVENSMDKDELIEMAKGKGGSDHLEFKK